MTYIPHNNNTPIEELIESYRQDDLYLDDPTWVLNTAKEWSIIMEDSWARILLHKLVEQIENNKD